MEIEGFQSNCEHNDECGFEFVMEMQPFEYNNPFGYNNSQSDKYCSDQGEIESNSEGSKEDTINVETVRAMKREKRIKKKIKKDKELARCKNFMYLNVQSKDIFRLCSGIFITNDGVIRFCYCLSSVSFGFCPQQMVQIEQKNSLGLIDITQNRNNQIPRRSVKDCVDYIMRHNLANLKREDISSKFSFFEARQTDVYHKNKLPQELKQMKEVEYNEFIKNAYFYIQEQQMKQKNMYFTYAIGRYNFIDQEVEIAHLGQSKNYLALLGLDYESFKQILLRNQKVDLIQDKLDIIRAAMMAINFKIDQNPVDNYQLNIHTFDGYPLTVNFITTQVTLSQKINGIFGNEYILCISQAIISPEQLQGLIEYRKKLMSNTRQLTLDEYIRKELSYLFEDVEYSVHSQQFLEKYYQDNLQTLLEQAQYLTFNHSKSKQCGYRTINDQFVPKMQRPAETKQNPCTTEFNSSSYSSSSSCDLFEKDNFY